MRVLADCKLCVTVIVLVLVAGGCEGVTVIGCPWVGCRRRSHANPYRKCYGRSHHGAH